MIGLLTAPPPYLNPLPSPADIYYESMKTFEKIKLTDRPFINVLMAIRKFSLGGGAQCLSPQRFHKLLLLLSYSLGGTKNLNPNRFPLGFSLHTLIENVNYGVCMDLY